MPTAKGMNSDLEFNPPAVPITRCDAQHAKCQV